VGGQSVATAGTPAFDQAVAGGGRFLWTVGEDRTLRIAPWSDDIHHTVLTGGAPVLGAGEAEIQRGIVQVINNRTGHYTPCGACSGEFLQQGVDAFQGQGIPVLRRGITDLGGN